MAKSFCGSLAARACAILLQAAIVVCAYPASAQPVDVPETYGGDLLTRPRLAGDWFGFRDQAARHGLTFDANLLNLGQGVASGGRDKDLAGYGRADMTMNFDSGKAGLWPGGFLKVHAQTNYGKSINQQSGAISSPNGVSIFPVPNHADFAVPNVTVTQFLAPWFGIYAGKVETLDADANEFADDNQTKFLNLGFEITLTGAFVPQSALGGGLIFLPWKGAVFVVGVLDPDGDPTEAGLDDPFKNGYILTAEGRITVQPFGLLGHQLLGFARSDRKYVSLEQDPSNLARSFLQSRLPRLSDPGPVLRRIVERFFPNLLVPTEPINRENEAWSLYYNFDQYFWSPAGRPESGIGMFFRFGLSDGKVNPIKYHYSAGIGGKHIVPGRPKDTFGIGWSRLEFSDDFARFLRRELDLGLKHEDTFEAYYNFNVTDWFTLTADLQVIDTGLTKKLGSDGRLKDMDTAIVVGLRSVIKF